MGLQDTYVIAPGSPAVPVEFYVPLFFHSNDPAIRQSLGEIVCVRFDYVFSFYAESILIGDTLIVRIGQQRKLQR